MNMNGKVYYPGGSLPLTLTAVLAVLTACVQGVCFAEPDTAHGGTGRAWQYVLLGFKVIFSVLACSTLLTNLITVRYTGSFGTFIRRINGVRLLQTYGQLGKAYHQMAFLVMLLLSLTVVFLLVSVSAFLGRSRFFSRLCVAGIATDMAAVLLVGVSCKYFEVVQGLNEELIFMLLPDQLTPYLPQVTYKLSSDAIYPMLIGVLLLGVLLILSPMSRDERERARTEGRGTRAVAGKTVGAPDTEKPDFDPCPAFTELDGRRSRLSADADVRREQAFPSPTLESVVRFVVSYARDSRLHLSYREEEIADFIAGAWRIAPDHPAGHERNGQDQPAEDRVRGADGQLRNCGGGILLARQERTARLLQRVQPDIYPAQVHAGTVPRLPGSGYRHAHRAG